MSDLIRIDRAQPRTTVPLNLFSPGVYLQLLNQLDEGVYFVDRERRILLWNSAAARITGYSSEEVIGHSCFDRLLQHTAEDGSPMCGAACPLKGILQEGKELQCRVHLLHKDGHRLPVQIRARPILDGRGRYIGALETFRDLSEQLASLALVKSLEEAAYLDPLTGVGNRRYCEIKLCEAVSQTRRLGWSASLMFVDIDRFKAVNDTYGHLAGDAVLRTVAETLAHNLRSFDFVGRWGGEEFIVLTSGVTDEVLIEIANRLRKLIENSATLHEENRIGVTISVGATPIRSDDTSTTLLDRADRLLYTAKQHRNLVVTDENETAVEHHVLIVSDTPHFTKVASQSAR